jgi:BirA family transcriptional regulator, biotin operon repressor / biotin---[acetyl-CoA-carboxylase] ligase
LIDIQRFETLGSTNDELMRQAHAGAPDGKWIYTDIQTQGRGRQGRQWISTQGNLFCSTLVRLPEQNKALSQLSFVAALAVHDFVAQYIPLTRIKWPNDILCDGQKIAGILLETHTGANASSWVVIGIGINLAQAPSGLERPVTSLKAMTGVAPLLPQSVEFLAHKFQAWRDQWAHNGFDAIRQAWLARATGIGAQVNVRIGQEQHTGIFEGLDGDGALLLRLDSGALRVVHAGEVFEV